MAVSYNLSNFVPSSAVSGPAASFGLTKDFGSFGGIGGTGSAFAGPLLMSTIGDEMEIEVGVINMQLAPTASDMPPLPLMLTIIAVVPAIPAGHSSRLWPASFFR